MPGDTCKYCNRPIHLKGMCPKHYLWDLHIRKKQQCKIDGCTKHVFEEGLCKSHYSKAHPKICKAPNCNQYADAAKGYCWRHYRQVKRYGKLQYIGELHRMCVNEYEFHDDGCHMLFHDSHGDTFGYALIDPIDYIKVKDYKWTLSEWENGYLDIRNGNNGLALSRLIMDTPDDLVCDHINGNRLDNRRSNLRNCTQMENCWNRHAAQINNKLGIRGISRSNPNNDLNGGYFKVSLVKDGKYYTRYEKTLDIALQKRDELIKELYGEFCDIA